MQCYNITHPEREICMHFKPTEAALAKRMNFKAEEREDDPRCRACI